MAAKFLRVAASTAKVSRISYHSRAFSASTSCNKSETIGFVGLGNMGGHMARNLLQKNNPVIVYDVIKESVKSLEEAGAKTASCPADVAAETRLVVTMLPSSPHVKEVYTASNGLFSSIKAGTLLLDCSTIDPAVSQDMAKQADKKGAVYMDAPVSGGVVAAKDATLTFMVGGKESSFERAKEVLSQMGKNVVHCGAVGTGQAAKICNNMLLGISMFGTAETMNLGIKLGLEPKMLAEILNMSSGRCWSTAVYNPCPGVIEGLPASKGYEGGFGSALMAKDLGLAQNAALAQQTPTPMGALAYHLYKLMCVSGYGKKDFGSAFKFVQEMEEKDK